VNYVVQLAMILGEVWLNTCSCIIIES
jgi:hypothetical protein